MRSGHLPSGTLPPRALHRFSRLTTIPFVSTHADPPPKSLDDAPLIPLTTANIFSRITFQWIQPLLNLGYARPVEAADLWKMDESRSAQNFAKRIDESFERRVREAEEYNARLDRGEIRAPLRKRIWWTLKGKRAQMEEQWQKKDGRKRANLAFAIK